MTEPPNNPLGQVPEEPAPPSLTLTIVISILFGPFGAIPAGIHAERARAMGAASSRYWVAFAVTWVSQIILGFAIYAGILLVALGMVTSTSPRPGERAPTIATGKSKSASPAARPLRVGVSFNMPGLGYEAAAPSAGGFDIAVARYIATNLGFGDVEFVEVGPAERETRLQARMVDVVIAAYVVTPDRQKQVTFAGPYLLAQQGLLVAANSTIRGPKDLSGMRLCSLPGSTLASSIQREYARTVKLVERESRESCVQALLDGDLDALTADDAVLAGLASQPEFTGKARLADRWGPEFSYAVGLNRSDLGLCSRVSVALQAMVDDGSWARAVKEHLAHGGYTPIRGNPPAANLCN